MFSRVRVQDQPGPKLNFCVNSDSHIQHSFHKKQMIKNRLRCGGTLSSHTVGSVISEVVFNVQSECRGSYSMFLEDDTPGCQEPQTRTELIFGRI